MGRNLDLDHCANKQQAAIAEYAEELEENDKKIAEGAWATTLEPVENNLLVPDSNEILHEPPPHSTPEVGTGKHEETKGPDGFLFLRLGLSICHRHLVRGLEFAGDHRVHGQEDLAACLGGLALNVFDCQHRSRAREAINLAARFGLAW